MAKHAKPQQGLFQRAVGGVVMRRVLVPLAVFALLALFWFWPRPEVNLVPDFPSDVAQCSANLRRAYVAFVLSGTRNGQLPEASGPALLEALMAAGALESETLVCPGPRARPLAEGARVAGYAARDTGAFPLHKFPSGGSELEPLVACDNGPTMNHDGCMNVLYSDGSVVILTLEDEIASGRLPPDARTIPVGPDSPLPDLRKLTGN